MDIDLAKLPSIWIGLGDEEDEGLFTYNSSGMPISYSNWITGQPDDKGATQNCVAVNNNAQWRDLPCENVNPFLCEIVLQ